MHKKPHIAIVYDRLNKFGGAERVLQSLLHIFPDADLVTSVYDKTGASWVRDRTVRTSFLQHLPFARTHHEWFGWLMPLVFESFDLSSYDIIVSVTSEAAKGVITRSNQLHVCYCLTPTRYLWSHTSEYEGKHLRFLKRFVFSVLREWDYVASKRPDLMIPISHHIARRITQYYRRRQEDVIYPPVSMSTIKQKRSRGSYYLVVARLVPYKQVGSAIRACQRLGRPLHIVGIGSDLEHLHAIAGQDPNITFCGMISDAQLAREYSDARALLCPQEEDFGIVSVEAQSLGVPVISYANSGMAETVVDQKTGILFNSQTDESLVDALRHFETKTWDASVISRHARQFSQEVFEKKFKEMVILAYQKKSRV
jgi:glycosyltransferase involved in cell wall biosynthesis